MWNTIERVLVTSILIAVVITLTLGCVAISSHIYKSALEDIKIAEEQRQCELRFPGKKDELACSIGVIKKYSR